MKALIIVCLLVSSFGAVASDPDKDSEIIEAANQLAALSSQYSQDLILCKVYKEAGVEFRNQGKNPSLPIDTAISLHQLAAEWYQKAGLINVFSLNNEDWRFIGECYYFIGLCYREKAMYMVTLMDQCSKIVPSEENIKEVIAQSLRAFKRHQQAYEKYYSLSKPKPIIKPERLIYETTETLKLYTILEAKIKKLTSIKEDQ